MQATPLSIRLDAETRDALSRAAEAAQRTVSGHAADLIRAGLAQDISPAGAAPAEHPLVVTVTAMFAEVIGPDVPAQREAAMVLARVAAAGGAPAVSAVKELRSSWPRSSLCWPTAVRREVAPRAAHPGRVARRGHRRRVRGAGGRPGLPRRPAPVPGLAAGAARLSRLDQGPMRRQAQRRATRLIFGSRGPGVVRRAENTCTRCYATLRLAPPDPARRTWAMATRRPFHESPFAAMCSSRWMALSRAGRAAMSCRSWRTRVR